jgi:hypothetical protein
MKQNFMSGMIKSEWDLPRFFTPNQRPRWRPDHHRLVLPRIRNFPQEGQE